LGKDAIKQRIPLLPLLQSAPHRLSKQQLTHLHYKITHITNALAAIF